MSNTPWLYVLNLYDHLFPSLKLLVEHDKKPFTKYASRLAHYPVSFANLIHTEMLEAREVWVWLDGIDDQICIRFN
jgi:hypothetical protein